MTKRILKRQELFAVHAWMTTKDPAFFADKTRRQVCEMVSEEMGFEVTDWNIKRMVKDLGGKIRFKNEKSIAAVGTGFKARLASLESRLADAEAKIKELMT